MHHHNNSYNVKYSWISIRWSIWYRTTWMPFNSRKHSLESHVTQTNRSPMLERLTYVAMHTQSNIIFSVLMYDLWNIQRKLSSSYSGCDTMWLPYLPPLVILHVILLYRHPTCNRGFPFRIIAHPCSIIN